MRSTFKLIFTYVYLLTKLERDQTIHKDSSGMGLCTGIPGYPGEYRLSDWQATDVSQWRNRKT